MSNLTKKFILGINGVIEDPDGNRVGTIGTGKDTVADTLVESWGAFKIAMADPLKRIARDVYEFTDEQLWGPSQFRNLPDTRYPRFHTDMPLVPRHDWDKTGDEDDSSCKCCGLSYAQTKNRDDYINCYLTPRYALQLLGTEWGRTCHEDTWVNKAVMDAKRVLFLSGVVRSVYYNYNQKVGLSTSNTPRGDSKIAVIPDVRFKNEVRSIKTHGGLNVRIIRPGPKQAFAVHRSEQESLDIPDSEFDLVIRNDRDLAWLKEVATRMVFDLSGML